MFTVYSKPACPACEQSKSLLKSKSISYKEVIIDYGQEKSEEKVYVSREEFMQTYPTIRTLPLIIQDDTHKLLGFQDLRQILSQTAERAIIQH